MAKTDALLAALFVSVSLAACTTLPRPAVEDGPANPGTRYGDVITQAEIARSGAIDAFQALERGGTYLHIVDTGGDRPARIGQRGAGSLFMGNTILLVVDGTPVRHTQQVLRSIPASSITYIRVLSGHEASAQWGSEAANGVIVIATSAR